MKILHAVDEFLFDSASGIRTEASRRSYRLTLRAFGLETGNKDLHHYQAQDLAGWLRSKDWAPNTLNARKVRLRAFFDWAEYRQYIASNPARHLNREVPSKAKNVMRHHWLTPEQVRTILESCPDTVTGRRDSLALRLGFTVGLRRAEIAGLRWEDVDLEGQQATVMGKGEKLASVWLPDRLHQEMLDWGARTIEDRGGLSGFVVNPVKYNLRTGELFARYGERLSVKAVNRIAAEASERTGIKFRPHDMRRTWAGILHDRSDIETVSAALRHSNLGVTQRYLESRQDASFQAARKVGVDL